MLPLPRGHLLLQQFCVEGDAPSPSGGIFFYAYFCVEGDASPLISFYAHLERAEGNALLGGAPVSAAPYKQKTDALLLNSVLRSYTSERYWMPPPRVASDSTPIIVTARGSWELCFWYHTY